MPLPPSPPPDKLYAVIDGTGVPMTSRETATRKGKAKTAGARTREVKLAVFFTQDKLDTDGHPVRDRASTSVIATFEPASVFAGLVKAEAIRRGADHIRQFTIIGDGAAWIWGIATAKFPEATQIVDLYHAREHLHSLTRALEFMLPGQRDQWLAARLEDLDYGYIDGIEAAVRQYPLEGAKKDEAEKELGYFLSNAPRMRYHWFRSDRSRRCPGSGASRVGAGGDGAAGIGGPRGPGADVQARRDARQLQRQHLVRGGDAGPAIRADGEIQHTRLPRRDAEALEAPPQLGGRQEPAVRADVGRGRRAHGARDVAGRRIDRLDLAAVALPRPRVEQHAGPGQRGCAGRVQQRKLARGRGEIARLGRRLVHGDRLPGVCPGAEAAVEHAHLVVAEVPQRPPGAGGDRRVAVVIDHDRVPAPDAEPAHRGLEVGGGRQRVPAAGARRSGQVGVQVHERGAGQVARAVAVDPGRPAQPPAHVEQDRRCAVGQLAGQRLDVDQRMAGAPRSAGGWRPGPG